jgi:3,4-dihydroxy-2-butanone 4-phosphate synthase
MNIATPNDTAMPESCGRFSPIEEILDELRAGRMIVLVDDEHRENEGDLRRLTPARTSPPALPRATAPAPCYP